MDQLLMHGRYPRGCGPFVRVRHSANLSAHRVPRKLCASKFATERRPATSHEDKIFATAPRWAGVLNEKLILVLAGQLADREREHNHTLLHELHEKLDLLTVVVRREARADKERDRQTMATQAEVLAKVAEAKTVSESANIGVKEAIRLLKEGQSDPAKNDEAMALLSALIADDNAVLEENTPEE